MYTSMVLTAFLTSVFTQNPPGKPYISAPSFVLENNPITLYCSSSGGSPPTSVIWYRGGNLMDQTATTFNGITTNDYTFIANRNHHLAVYECRVDNSVLQSDLTATWYFSVYVQPQPPSLTGPTFITHGTTNQWICISTGGIPASTITVRIGNNPLTSVVMQTSVQQSDKTFTTFGFLSWTASLVNNGQTLYCDVRQPETLGNTVQTASLQLTVNAEPNKPVLTGPSAVILGTTYQWVCVSTGGSPTPTMIVSIGNRLFTTGISQTSVLESNNTYTVTTVLIWAPKLSDTGQILYCSIEHSETMGSSLKTVSLLLTVYAHPNQPILTGPTTLELGSFADWTCVSTGGRPAPKMTLRIGNNPLTNGFTQTSILQSDNTYTVTTVISWAPSVIHNGQILSCDIQHQQTQGSNLQTASLLLIVNARPNPPTLTGPSIVILRQTNQWTCISKGGNPAPVVTLRIGNNTLSNTVSHTFSLESDNTFRVTSVLSWAPSTYYNGQTLYCDVLHTETLGSNLQTASLPIQVHASPNPPNLLGPSIMTLGTTNHWSCISSGGLPAPSVIFKLDTKQLTTGVTQITDQQLDNTYTVTSNLTWLPNNENDGQTLYCEVQHVATLGNNLQTTSLHLTINVEPNQSILTGPTTVTSRTTNQWTCLSTGGRPAPLVTLRINSISLTDNVTQTSVLQSDNRYTVTAVLFWVPSTSNNGQSIYCDVQHPATRGNNSQITSLPLTVYAQPNQPTLTGPTTVEVGSLYQWTCISTGGYPLPNMTLWVGNSQFKTGLSQSSALQSDNTYTVRTMLLWYPDLSSHDQILYCEVQHQETFGNTLQKSSIQLTVYAEPNAPTLTGPTSITSGSNVEWTCTSSGGNPAPVVTMRIENTAFTSGIIQTYVLQSDNSITVTEVLSWSPTLVHSGQRLYCDVLHEETRGQNLQTASIQLHINAEPNEPTMTGPAAIEIGESGEWRCTSTGGNPAPNITYRMGNNQITDGTTYSVVLQPGNTYTVTRVLIWTPSTASVNQAIYCDVQHPETRGSNVQTTSIQITVSNPNAGASSNDSMSSGMLAAIVLSVLAFLIIIGILFLCCCTGCCAYLRGRKKKEKITPEPYLITEPEIYRKQSPIFFEKQEFKQPSEAYEITKTVILNARDYTYLESKAKDIGGNNKSLSTAGIGLMTLQQRKYTYTREEQLRRLRENKRNQSNLQNKSQSSVTPVEENVDKTRLIPNEHTTRIYQRDDEVLSGPEYYYKT